MKIFKFGGGILTDYKSIKQLSVIVKENNPSVVVVSAMNNTTKNLENIFEKVLHGKSYNDQLDSIFDFYRNISYKLSIEKSVATILDLYQNNLSLALKSYTNIVNRDLFYSSTVSWGELITSQIVYHYLLSEGVQCDCIDVRECIKTAVSPCNASVCWDITKKLVNEKFLPIMEQKKIIITQGFIASDKYNNTTTLGREGSDFTGAILSNTLSANSLTIWKDVPGIMNADPKIFCNRSFKCDRLSYKTVSEMIFYGTKAIHHNTIKPLATSNIPLYVKQFSHPEKDGTLVTNEATNLDVPILILDQNQWLITLSINNYDLFNATHLRDVICKLELYYIRSKVIFLHSSSISLCVQYDLSYNDKLNLLLNDFNEGFEVHVKTDITLLTEILPDGVYEYTMPYSEKFIMSQHEQGYYHAVIDKNTSDELIEALKKNSPN